MIFLFSSAHCQVGNVPTFRLQAIYKGQRGGSRFTLLISLAPLSWFKKIFIGDDHDHPTFSIVLARVAVRRHI